jgi:serine/threonine protein kinase
VDEDIPSRPHCIVKQLCLHRPTPQLYAKAVQLFQQEAVRLDDLGHHPQIPALLAHFEQNRLLYLVQDFIEGQTLADELQQQGAFSETKLIQLLRDLLPTLQFIHDRQVIHRDIKPSNIIRRQSDHRLVLIDFGIAKLISSKTAAKTGTIVGTAEFMAPEQNRGKAFPSSDLYSLAVVCIHLLTGLSPFDLFDDSNDCWIWRDRLPAHTSIDPTIGLVLDKMLAAAVKQRYSTATEVLQALDQTSSPASPPVVASPSSPPVSVKPSPVLTSKSGIDYQHLKSLLASQQWRQADEETWKLIQRLLNKLPSSFLFSGEFQRIPCEDLLILDRLWSTHSRGRFGFSVQAQIYLLVGEDYAAFCDRVGWQRDNNRDSDFRWQFERSAPTGHLPSRPCLGGQQWWRHMTALTTRLQECQS